MTQLQAMRNINHFVTSNENINRLCTNYMKARLAGADVFSVELEEGHADFVTDYAHHLLIFLLGNDWPMKLKRQMEKSKQGV